MNKYFGEEVEDPKDGSGFNSRDMHDVLNKTQGRAHSSPSATLCPTVEACARIYVPRITRYTSCCTGLSRSFPSELLHFLQNKLRELIHQNNFATRSKETKELKSKSPQESNKIKFLRQGLKTQIHSPFAYSQPLARIQTHCVFFLEIVLSFREKQHFRFTLQTRFSESQLG